MRIRHKTACFISAFILFACAGCGGDRPSEATGRAAAVSVVRTVKAEVAKMPQWYRAVGTVRARTDVRVEAQVTGRVLNVSVRPGESVKKGQVLVRLDDREARSRLEQARQGYAAAQAGLAQSQRGVESGDAQFRKAEATYRRMKGLFEQKAISAEEMEKSESAWLQTRAGLEQAKRAVDGAKAGLGEAEKLVHQAEIALGYTVVRAQEDGEVARRSAEPGDLAFPGKVLLTLQTGGSLRLEAQVRESLIGTVRVGDILPVEIAAIGNDPLQGSVEEIEPLADPGTRSFLVKAGIPAVPGVYPGMFGRLLVPRGDKEIVLVPAEAVRRVGQLETVLVQEKDGWTPVYVRVGEARGMMVEIVSGLSGTETLGVAEAGR